MVDKNCKQQKKGLPVAKKILKMEMSISFSCHCREVIF